MDKRPLGYIKGKGNVKKYEKKSLKFIKNYYYSISKFKIKFIYIFLF